MSTRREKGNSSTTNGLRECSGVPPEARKYAAAGEPSVPAFEAVRPPTRGIDKRRDLERRLCRKCDHTGQEAVSPLPLPPPHHHDDDQQDTHDRSGRPRTREDRP